MEFGNFSELSEVRFLFLLKCVVLAGKQKTKKDFCSERKYVVPICFSFSTLMFST